MNMRSFSANFPAVKMSADEQQLVAAFVEAITAGKAPDAAGFLSPQETSQASPDLLAALACVEIEQRLTPISTAAGTDVTCDLRTMPRPVQQWLDVFPQLRESPACLVEIILADYLLRRSAGEAVLDDYLQQFPQLAETISARLAELDPQATLLNPSSPTLPPNDATLSLVLDPEMDTQAPRSSPNSPRQVRPVGPAQQREFGDYILEQEIARGGMGVVYKAIQRRLNRTVAVKMILAGQLASAEEVQRFYSEAEAAAQLDHPGIVPIYEVDEVDGQHFFSMGFVDGQGLDQRLKNGPLPPREAADILCQVAEAIAYAHTHGVVHRDLKPSNILLTGEGRPRVTDFGLAKTIEGNSGLTASGQILGTPGYMPPEQALGKICDVGPHSDVYSLGAVLYCLLTGRPPFQASTIIETLRQVVEREPASPRLLNPDVDVDLETLCLKCLEKNPAQRMESAAELAAELKRYLQGEPILSRRVGAAVRAGRWVKRHRTRVAISALVTISLIVVAGAIGVARRSAAAHELMQWSNAFEAAMEEIDLTSEQLGMMETLIAQVEQREPEEAKVFRRRLLDAWTTETERAIRRPYLKADAIQRLESALTTLEQRDALQAARLRTLLEQRKSQWQSAFRLTAPFPELASVFPRDAVEVRAGMLYPRPSPEAPSDTVDRSPTHVTATRINSGPQVQFQATFNADWEQAQEIGLRLNHEQDSGYDFLLRPTGDLSAQLEIPQDRHTHAEVHRQSFAEARQLGGRVLIEIRRNGSPIQKHEEPLDGIAAGPLQLRVKRDRGELSLQINARQPLAVRDPFPIGSAKEGVFAVRWPAPVGLLALHAEEMLSGLAVTTLEQADALFEQEHFDEAAILYNQQSVEAQEREVQQEAHFKYGLCLSHLNRVDEAMQVFQPLFAEAGERWPPQAGVQLWLMLIRQSRYDDADAVYELLSSRYSFEQLALMVPADVRGEVLTAYGRGITSLDNAITFRPEQIRNLERAAAVDRLLSYDGRGDPLTQVELSRGYRFIGDDEASLRVLEPIVRTTYHSVPWCHYLRTLRLLDRDEDALLACNQLLAATHSEQYPNLQAMRDRAYIHVAREDWDAAEADVLGILEYQRDAGPPGSHLFQSLLLGGFLRADRGDEPGALQYWRQGYQQGRPLLGNSTVADSSSVCVLMMGSLCGELSDEEGWRAFQMMAGGSANPATALATQLVNQAALGQALRQMWKTPRGWTIAREFAYDRLTLRQRIEQPLKLAGTQYVANSAFGGHPAPEQEQVIWQALTMALEQALRDQRLNMAQVMQLGLSWKGTSNLFGWQGVAPTLEPALRGPTAYLMAHRYARLNNLPQAERFLQSVVEDAVDDAPLAQLAREELQLLKAGQARLSLQRRPSPEADQQPIELILHRDGKEVQRVSLGAKAELDLAAGHYTLSLAQPSEDVVLTATELTLIAADRAVIDLESRWRPGPDGGALRGLLPRPADLLHRGRWQLISRDPLNSLSQLAQSPSGEFLAASGDYVDGVVRIYDRKLNLRAAFPAVRQHDVAALSWSPDSRLLAVAGRDQQALELWDPIAARRVARWSMPNAHVRCLAWSPSGDRIAGGAWDGRTFIWSASGTLLAAKKHELGSVAKLAWSPDAKQIAFIAGHEKIACWSLAEDALSVLAEETASHRAELAFSPHGRYLAVANLQQVEIWDWPARRLKRTVSAPANYSASIAWAADENVLWARADSQLLPIELDAADEPPATPRTILAGHGLLYDAASRLFTGYRWPRQLVRFGEDGATTVEGTTLHRWTIRALAFHPDGRRFAVAEDADRVRIMDSRGILERTIALPSHSSFLAFNAQGTLLAVACDDGRVRLFDPNDGTPAGDWPAHASAVRAVAFHPGGEKLASCGVDNTVRLWSRTGDAVSVVPADTGHERPLNFVSFSPDGTRLAAAGSEGDLLVWDEQGNLAGSFRAGQSVKALAWNRAGSQLALAAGQEMQLCSPDGQPQAKLGKPQGIIVGCHWSDAGELLVVDEHGGMRNFDAAGTLLTDWRLDIPVAGPAVFDPQGQQLLTTYGQAMLHGWLLPSRRPTFTTAVVDDKTLTFDGMGRLQGENADDIAPLMYLVESPEGFSLQTQKQFGAHVLEDPAPKP